MPGLVCLQGGAEFGPACREMDAELVIRSGVAAGAGPVVVVALAARTGREYAAAATNGVRHFTALGAPAVAARDFRVDSAGALDAVAEAALLVLPGGSPGRLRDALVGTAMGHAVAAVLARGGAVMGASAGAMVLCGWMWVPDRGGAVRTGLGHVPDVVVLPHYRGGPPPVPAPAGTTLLGLPECSGVLVDDDGMTALGVAPAVLVDADGAERPI